MKKITTVVTPRNKILKEPKLTIGLDLGDRTSRYCILNEAGEVMLEHSVPTTPKGIQEVFSKISRSRIALETGTHSPWVSRLLTQLGHEVIVAHARNVRLIGESSRKDDRLDAKTLARLARIDPGLLGPVRHRSAKAQIHLNGDPRPSDVGQCADIVGKCGTRVDEIVRRAIEEVCLRADESGDRQGTEPRVAGCSGSVVAGNRNR